MKCKRHPVDQRLVLLAGDHWMGPNGLESAVFEDGYLCRKCDTFVPKVRSLRGKRANRRGRSQSAAIAKDTGGENHEVRGTAVDVQTGIYNVQSKKDNGLFSERHWKLLRSIPADGRVPALVVKDAPGPGKRVRGYAMLKYEDWLEVTGVKA